MLAIPAIAWAAIKGMETIGQAAITGVSGIQGAATGATSPAAIGNMSMGNVSMDQMQLAPNRTSPFMRSWQDDLTGDTSLTNMRTGLTAVHKLQNMGFASRIVSVGVSEQDVMEASRSADAARSEAITATNERSAALAEVLSKGSAKLRSDRETLGRTTSGFEEIGSSVDRLDAITNSVAEQTGLSSRQVAQIAFNAAASGGLRTPFGGAQAGSNTGRTYQSGLSAEEQKVLSNLSQDELKEFKRFGDRVSRDAGALTAFGADNREADEMSSRLAEATSRAARADAAYAERTALAESLRGSRERGDTISIDLAKDPHNLEMFRRYAEQYGGDSASAFVLLESELARQGLRPNRVFSDGTALPMSFQDIRERYTSNASDPRLNPNTYAQDKANDLRVLSSGGRLGSPRSGRRS